MKCYLVSAQRSVNEPPVAQRFAGTNASAKEIRDQLMAQYELKKKQVIIEDFEIPTAKPDLLAFVNKMAELLDDSECVVPKAGGEDE